MHTRTSLINWQALHKFTYQALKIHVIVSDIDGFCSLPILTRIQELFSVDYLQEMSNLINDIVRFLKCMI